MRNQPTLDRPAPGQHEIGGRPEPVHERGARLRMAEREAHQRIRSGEWLQGEQIPSVRQIAEEYGVSIGTARRATAVLTEEGLVVVTPSWGAFIPE
jgi:DNA-binding FadR family transcriptional regulator